MNTFVTVVHIVTCVLLVLVVLIQAGKGAEISASFGGSSQTVFGSSGGQNFFTKFTYGAAAVFMVTSLFLTISASKGGKSVFEGVQTEPRTTATQPITGQPLGSDTGAKPVPQNAAPAPGTPAQNAVPAQNAAPAKPAK